MNHMYTVFFKRLFDFIMAAVALILLFPVFGVIAWKIKRNLGSPVIFTQARPGKDGHIFRMYKFRSMTDACDENGKLLPDADRLTAFGKRLRATSLDELPELLNILKGDMSVVGPRPQLVRDMVFFDEQQMQRQSVYPGLTGLAQINGRNNITWEEKFEYDLQYIRKITFKEDLRIIYRTVFKVVGQEDVAMAGMETAEDYGDYLLRMGKVTEQEYCDKITQAVRILGESSL